MNATDYKDLLEELRTEYLQSFQEKFEILKKSFAQKDWPSIESEFHKLKGTGKTYGAPEVSELCFHLERICKEKQEISEELLNTSIGLLTRVRDKYLDGQDFDLSTSKDFENIRSL